MDENFFKHRFDWGEYVNKYEDLKKAKINTNKKAWKHARKYGYKEKRDIFKGDMDLLNKFRDFCNTGEVKPIPQEECKVEYNGNIFVIDCQPLQHEIRGIGMYGVNLVNELITKYSHKFSFHLIINNFLGDELINNRIITQETSTIHKINFENIVKPLDGERNVYFNSNEIEYEKILANYINNLKPMYFLNLSEFDRRKIMINIDLLNKNVRTFSILHDLIPLKQGYYDKISEKWTINYNKQLNNLKKYDNLLSNSEFTKKDCSDVFNNIETIGTIVKDYKYSFSKEHEQLVLAKFNINKKYIYCQTAFGDNKGLSFLYEQYLKLLEVIKNDMLLVFGSNIPENYIKKNNMNDKNVIITGYLSEEDLHILHENAWLFVFPSTYEGFGIPPVEAMKHNKPVIVANNTSLVEVIGNDKFIFNHDEKSCADLITNLYRYQELYNKCIENSVKRKDLFNSDIVCLKLFSIITKFINNEIYFNGCNDIIKWKGYSLAEVNYSFTKALSNILNKEINVIEDRSESNYKGIKMFMDYPPDSFHDSYKILTNWGWEESIIPKSFVDKFQKLEFITVMSKYVKDTLINNGVNVPIFVTTLSKDYEQIKIQNNKSMFNKFEEKKYRFLHISSCMDRKGINELLEAYFKGFTKKDDVSLIIKTTKNIHNEDLLEKIKKYQNIDSPEIHLIYDFYTEEQINDLINICYAQILPSKSEGFGLPALHSMLIKKPVIFTNFSGYLDFGLSNPFLIDYTYVYSKSHFELNGSLVVQPKIGSIIDNMKKVINMPLEQLNVILENNYQSVKQFTWENNAKLFLNSYYNFVCKYKNNIKYPKIGVISNVNPGCGIGRYTIDLLNHNYPVTYLVPTDLEIDSNLAINSNLKKIEKCWKYRCENINLLMNKCEQQDVIIIHFNFGFFTSKMLEDIIYQLKCKKKIIIVELHAVVEFNKKNINGITNSNINCMLPNNLHLVDRLIVHSLFDINYLKDNHNLNNSILFNLGNKELNNINKNINNQIINIGTFGFCWSNKGIIELVKAFKKLNNNNLKLKLYTSIPVHGRDIDYENNIKNLIKDNENIDFNTEHIPDTEIQNAMKDIDLFVYPTKTSFESVSASIRNALIYLKPVIVSNSHIYNEFYNQKFIYKYEDFNNIDLLSEKINELINTDMEDINKNIILQKDYLESKTFKKMNELLINICKSLYLNY